MEKNLNKYKAWLKFLKSVEDFFEKEDFLKVSTPHLVPSGAMEASLHTFKIEKEAFYLPTSPEFALKKLWCSGLSHKIYEISSSFRAHELGEKHLAEFTMLEFYEAKITLKDLIKRTSDFLVKALGLESGDTQVLNLDELFLAFTGFELKPDSDKDFLKEVIDFHGLSASENSTWSDLYHIIYLEKIEPLLNQSLLVVLKNYPPQLAALAKINPEGWAERAEFFYGGVELGNGYDELLDSKEVKRRWGQENELRKKEEREPHPIDEVFLKTLSESTLESGAGVAIGLERVFALKNQESSVKVWPF